MKLTSAQADAITEEFLRKNEQPYREAKKKAEEKKRAIWDKTPDGKLYAKLPKWMQKRIEYGLPEQVESVSKHIEMPKPQPTYQEVRREVVLSTIGAASVDDVMKALERRFAND